MRIRETCRIVSLTTYSTYRQLHVTIQRHENIVRLHIATEWDVTM